MKHYLFDRQFASSLRVGMRASKHKSCSSLSQKAHASADTISNIDVSKVTKRILAAQRIGPHPKQILEYMIGNLLGDGSLERRNGASRFTISQENTHQEYLWWLHKQYADFGYCSMTKPIQRKRIGKQNKVRWTLRFNTWSYTSLNWLQELFYVPIPQVLIQRVLTKNVPNYITIHTVKFVSKGVSSIKPQIVSLSTSIKYRKVISDSLEYWLTPRVIACWFMDDGSVSGNLSTGSLKFATQGYSIEDVQKLQSMFVRKYKLFPTIHKQKKYPLQGILAFNQKDSSKLAKIIIPFMHPSLLYKLRGVLSSETKRQITKK